MRDIENGDTPRLQPINEVEQTIRLGTGKRRRRFVEDQHFRFMRHGTRNRHHLAIRKCQVSDIGRKVDGKAHARGDRRRFATHPARIEKKPRTTPVQPIEREIGRHIEIGDDAVIDVLMHCDNASTDCLGGRRWIKGSICQRDSAGTTRIDAREDAHERRFSGAVGTHQNRHCACFEVEVNTLQDRHRSKGFAHVLNAKHWLFAHKFLPLTPR